MIWHRWLKSMGLHSRQEPTSPIQSIAWLLMHWPPVTNTLSHWGRLTHICVSKLTTIGSDNGLSPGRRRTIIETNAAILLTGLLGTNFSEILIKIHIFSLKKLHLKMSSAKWRQFWPGLNMLNMSRICLVWPNDDAYYGMHMFAHPHILTQYIIV